MNLADCLNSLEKVLGLETGSLLPFAQEDNYGGFHADPNQRQWPIGSIWGVEGQILYALVRALDPLRCVELGVGQGCGATHITAALWANGGEGLLTSIDRGNSGGLIPADLKLYSKVLPGDAIEWLEAQPDGSIDFLFEDADHSEAFCRQAGLLAQRKLALGGVLVVHDAAHFIVGREVIAGYSMAGMALMVYLVEPSDCGVGIWTQSRMTFADGSDAEVVNAPDVEKPKRKRGAK